MQVPATSWINPAAATAQAATQATSNATSAGTPLDSLVVKNVEGAARTGDKDADGQYVPQDQSSQRDNKPTHEDSDASTPLSYTELPADDGESNQLDCWG